MIYITGDIHGDPRRFSTFEFPEQRKMTKDDYVVILGDFGLVWDVEQSRTEKYWLKWLDDKPFTTLFIDGNHENFDRLNNYPVEMWNGGKIHKISNSVYHLMRGQVFEIEGKKIFTFGGAKSHDISDGILEIGDPRIKRWNKDRTKMFRVNKLSWWKQELANQEEIDEALINLEKADWKVDFVFTHCCPTSTAVLLGGFSDNDITTNFLEDVRAKLDFKKWYFGHYHMDRAVNVSEICFYEKIIQISDRELIKSYEEVFGEER